MNEGDDEDVTRYELRSKKKSDKSKPTEENASSDAPAPVSENT